MKHKHKFRPRARLLQLLGDQLIGDPRIAVFELVKNAYDADSPSVAVSIRNVNSPETATVEILDNGDGMDLKTITEIWLEPGADHREKQRLAGIRSEKFDRLPLGEKGVGRFAAHKLGNKIELVTRRKNEKEICVIIDWEKLTTSRYLEDAPVVVETRVPKIFKGESHGTKIIISRLRHKWSRGDVRRLHRSINAISRPFDGRDGFSVNFTMAPDLKWLDGLIDAKDIEANALFTFDFRLSRTSFNFEYTFSPLAALTLKAKSQDIEDFGPRTVKKVDQNLEYFVMETDEDGKKKKRSVRADLEAYGIGEISGRLIGFDRDKEILELYVDPKSLTDYLDTNGGVRVYRDGIRVYNYGEPGVDWLGLDERRIQIPTRRIGNNLMLGEINLNLARSAKLIEKTNREGFVENAAYLELRKAVLAVVISFEQEREIDKSKIRELLKRKESETPFPVIRGPEEAITALRDKVQERGWSKDLSPFINKVDETYKEVRDTLLQAVGSGLGLSIVFHEIERGVRDINSALSNGGTKDRITELARHLGDLMDGASYFVRTADGKSFKASEVVDHAISSLSPRFSYHNVSIKNGFLKNKKHDFLLNGSRQMITASVVNLIDNALYWLNFENGAARDEKIIWVGPQVEEGQQAIIVADNGPGIDDAPETLVKPFFTRKPDGMGIGLYFVNMTMRAHGGTLRFPSVLEAGAPRACTGAIISMNFEKI